MDEKKCILIVDDDVRGRKTLSLLLEKKGYKTAAAGTGQEALKKAKSQFFNVILLDIKLPDMDGIDLLGPLKRIHHEIDIIIITGYASLENAMKALNKGASGYVTKPLNMDELLDGVKQLLRKQYQLMEERRLYKKIQQELADRMRTEQVLQRSKQKIEKLHKIAHRLTTCETEKEVYHLMVKAAKKILSFPLCTLYIAEDRKLEAKFSSSRRTSVEGRENPICTKLAMKTQRTGKTYIFGVLERIPNLDCGRKNFLCGISTPISDIGVFQTSSIPFDALTKDNVRLLKLLLDYAGEAIRQIRLQDDFRDKAIHDPLTGLNNRYYLNQALKKEVKRSKRYGRSIGFLMIDVNGFKKINDRYGHQIGDRILQGVASLLRESVREIDVVVRFGGDEFLIMLPETDGKADVVRQRIIEKMACRNEINKTLDFPASLSIGSAYWNPRNSETVEEVISRADKLMYEEKRANNRLPINKADSRLNDSSKIDKERKANTQLIDEWKRQPPLVASSE